MWQTEDRSIEAASSRAVGQVLRNVNAEVLETGAGSTMALVRDIPASLGGLGLRRKVGQQVLFLACFGVNLIKVQGETVNCYRIMLAQSEEHSLEILPSTNSLSFYVLFFFSLPMAIVRDSTQWMHVPYGYIYLGLQLIPLFWCKYLLVFNLLYKTSFLRSDETKNGVSHVRDFSLLNSTSVAEYKRWDRQ